MYLLSEDQQALADVARQLGVPAEALVEAIEAESAPELARLLGIGAADAAARLAPLLRVTMVNQDWGAGCQLLTDELRTELRGAFRALLPDGDHSASSGVSQG